MSRDSEVPDGCELIDGGSVASIVKESSTRIGTITNLSCGQEETDTRNILHGLEATKCIYDRIMVHSIDTDVFLLPLHFSHKPLFG